MIDTSYPVFWISDIFTKFHYKMMTKHKLSKDRNLMQNDDDK